MSNSTSGSFHHPACNTALLEIEHVSLNMDNSGFPINANARTDSRDNTTVFVPVLCHVSHSAPQSIGAGV
jgi:hypothetical protein